VDRSGLGDPACLSSKSLFDDEFMEFTPFCTQKIP
jgi:hypothetical protein